MKFAAKNKAMLRQHAQIVLQRLRPIHLRWVSMTNTPVFARAYCLSAAAILLITTLIWAFLGARLNLQNADQLVNPLLLQNSETFHAAQLPGSHSFLLKWPLFLLIRAFGFSLAAYVWVTVLTVLLTVGGLAFLLYRIERRPIVLGTQLLALASVLLAIPATPYPGALLPVNMAMLATRNIEYILYVIALYLLASRRRLRSRYFWLSLAVLTLLMASDKLFVSLTMGGAVIALMVYGLSRGWNLVSLSARWLLGGLISTLLGVTLLWTLSARHITHLVSESGLGPYGLSQSAHDIILGSIYAGLHFFTNFGANPASQTLILRDIPHTIVQNTVTLAGFGYICNFILCIFCVFAATQIVRHSLAHNKDAKLWLSHPAKLSTMLIWISVTAFAIFVASRHYYAGDARYLGIVFFTLCISGTTYVSRQNYAPSRLAGIGVLFIISCMCAIPAVVGTYHTSQAALSPFTARNERIAAALTHHPVQTVVGDYWRVIPLKSRNVSQSVLPLQSCTAPRNTLSSQAWEQNATKHSFAYILSLDIRPAEFPNCTLDQVIAAYGRPNASVVIEGTLVHPKEILLFFDNGERNSAPIAKLNLPSTVLPVELSELPGLACKQPTIMNVVAHEDDDLLFMNPDTLHAITAGNCVRTVYVTAGDAGQGTFYWLGREQGSQAAYGKMLGYNGIWVQRVVHISGEIYATIANPRGNTKISLVFLHLPDGGMRGQGFGKYHGESLAALATGRLPVIHDVYNGNAVSAAQLQAILLELMQNYQPTEIRTQAQVVSATYPDHSDHMAVSEFTQKAYHQYENEHFDGRVTIPIKFYIGYPVHGLGVNLSPDDIAATEDIFLTYAKYDSSVCHSLEQCRHDPAYGAYLPRQYQATQ